MRTIRTAVLLLMAAALCGVAVSQARAYERLTFDIAQQSLSDALRVFAAQAHVQILRRDEDVSLQAIIAPQVAGEFSAQEALGQLLSGSGIGYEFINDRTVRLVGSGHAGSADSWRSMNERASISSGDSGAHTDKDAASVADTQSDLRGTLTAAENVDEQAASQSPLQEVLVTAQKREERLQDVPISISVINGSELDKATAEGITETLNHIPGVATTVAYQSGGTQVAVRGVTASGALFNGSSPIAYYLDSVPFGLVKTAIAPDANAYDLQRVEVLRGPQGTLYGASAENGVVRVLTHDANLNQFDLKARTLGSFTEDGGGNYRGDGVINVPIIDGKVAARGVVGYQHLSGWIDRPNNSDANDAQLRNYRLKLSAQPTDALFIGVSAWSARNDYGAPSASANGRTNPSLVNESIKTDYDAYGLKIEYNFAPFTLSSTTSYLDYSNAGHLDLTELFGLPTLFTGLDAHVFAQEINLNSTTGAWKWSGGAFYRDGKDRLRQNNLGGGAPYDYDNASESYAVYGEVGRRFLQDEFEWTLGVRYFHDHVVVQENINQGPPGSPLIHSIDRFNSTTPRAVLTWYPTQRITAYGSYSEGFRSGFHQDPIVARAFPDFPTLKPDKLHNYEMGLKADLFDRRLSLDTAVYYIKWRHVQQLLVVPTQGTYTSAMINGQSASGVGVDLGLTARPITGLELGINLSWNDLAMDAPVTSSGVVLFEKGDRLNLSPKYTAGALASYVFPLGSGGLKGRFSVSGNYISEQSQRSALLGAPIVGTGDPMLIARTALSLDSGDGWSVTLFIDNVSNEQGAVQRPDLPVPDWAVRVRPRTTGLQLDYRFQ